MPVWYFSDQFYVCLGSVIGDINFGTVFDLFRLVLGQFWDHLGQFGVGLDPFWTSFGEFRVSFRSVLDHFWTTFVSILDHFWIRLTAVLNKIWISFWSKNDI